MIVFCPGCGTRISVAPSPLDPEGIATCPKCQSRFPTAGLTTTASPEPRRRFKPKKKGGGLWLAVGIAFLICALVIGTAAALYFGGVLNRPPSTEVKIKGPDGNVTTWKEYSSAEGKFRIMLPGLPTRIVRPSKDVEFRVDTPELQAVVVYGDLPEKANAEKYMVAPAGSKVISEKEIAQGNHLGRDIVAEIPNRGIVHMRYVLADRRLYTVMIVGKSKPVSDAEVARLFDSFQVTA